MEFKNWLSEAINVVPHLPHIWWKQTLDKAKELESKIEGKYDLVKQYNKVSNEIGFQSLYDLQIPSLFRNMMAKLSDNMDNYVKLKDANISSRDRDQLYNSIDVLTFYHITKKEIDIFTNFYIDYFKVKKHYDYALEELESSKKYIDNYDESKKVLEDTKVFLDSLFDYIKLLKNVQLTMSAYKDRQGIGHYERDKKAPSHKNVETLYHATPFLNEILRDGFKTKKEVEFEALGGETSDAISFTADFKIAKAIADSLKEVIDIANGKMGIGDVVKKIKAEKIDLSKFKDWQNGVAWDKSRKNFNPKERAYKLYQNYLAYSNIRYNPLYVVPYSNFVGLNKNNVGIISCTVDMSKSKGYMTGMEEFRIPLEGILKINKVIR